MLRRRQPERELITPDGSRIAELIGRVSSGDDSWSVARIVMPPGRGQPPRRNRFDEVLIVVSGACEVDLDSGTVTLAPDDVLDLPAGTRYAERGGPDGCVAWAICRPAFSRDLVEWDAATGDS
jgi:probable rRNA maturation factor